MQFKQSGSSPYFELCAGLPAKFINADLDRKEKSLRIRMEYVGSPELMIEWLPARLTRKEPVPIGGSDKPGQFEVTVPIPSGATGIEARLLTVEADVDQLSLRVNWENILLRICEFFDPDQAKLTRFLIDESNLKNANPFELGVARLMALAGYTLLWFGKAAKEGMADFAAPVRTPRGQRLLIHGECTVEYPARKLSDFAKRTDDLNKYLGLDAGSILPVVFSRNNVTAQDRKAAAELGLVLCGGSDIQMLQDKIKSDATPDEVFQFLRSLSNRTVIPGSLNLSSAIIPYAPIHTSK